VWRRRIVVILRRGFNSGSNIITCSLLIRSHCLLFSFIVRDICGWCLFMRDGTFFSGVRVWGCGSSFGDGLLSNNDLRHWY
jgi:hypothetical protein